MAYVMHVEKIPSEERGITENEWLNSKHTFSFGQYYNTKRLNFGTLRVFNDDVIQPGKGFGMHSHDNMEVVTIVLSGVLEHRDSQGNIGQIKSGEIQRMTAGSGIKHSEYNASQTEPVHLLQIWVYPKERNLSPEYEQKSYKIVKNFFTKVISQNDGVMKINQDAEFLLGEFDAGHTIKYEPKSLMHGDYIFVIDGQIQLGGRVLKKGDSAQVTQVDQIEMQAEAPSKILLIEVDVNTL